jgi:hypothetical protein
MTSTYLRPLLIGAAMLALVACNKTSNSADNGAASANAMTGGNETAAASNDPVASAESAAPAAIAHNASVVTMDDKGNMTEVRKGSNGWTCIPDSPATPGPDPMCADANATKWAVAWIHHQTPPAGAVGVIYMLEGGTDTSNTDPYAPNPTEQNDWIKTGPHVMVVGSKEVLAGYPSGSKPDTTGPYVMWAGTPYAHLMVPMAK